ncbi:MAG TPA: hypothetical protein VE954_27845, partial [Oligoflexus sp.]|uniref:hypothetical protein n=1 Tax=Oligoflexus sp. TaxID=1971216 RepID=UPI002D4B6A98
RGAGSAYSIRALKVSPFNKDAGYTEASYSRSSIATVSLASIGGTIYGTIYRIMDFWKCRPLKLSAITTPWIR